MPFAEDCQDRSGGAPDPLDTMRQIVRLTGLAEGLGAEELLVLVTVAERLALGRQRYGSLDLDTDPRDFRRECFEELADACVYMAADVLKGGRR